MKLVSTIALAASLLGGATVFAAAPAAAQAQPAQAQAPARTYTLSRAEREALAPLQTAVEARNYAAAQAALPAARAGAAGADAKYVLGQLMLRWGIDTQNIQMQSDAIQALIDSGGAQPTEMPLLYRNQAALLIAGGSLDRADAAMARVVELSPNDPQALVQLAEIKVNRDRDAEALPLFERAFGLLQASNQQVPENWIKRALAVAYEARMVPQSLALARQLVTAYPSEVNWRDALLIHRQLTQPDEATTLDYLRLMRASQSLTGERDYQEMASTLLLRGFPGEAQAVLQEGVQRRHVSATEAAFRDMISRADRSATQDRAGLDASVREARSSTAARNAIAAGDALYGYGRYAEAAELYRAALTRAGADANLVNTRLGAALALAGQRAEAEAAFRAVTGPRAGLAELWLAWLARRAA